MYYFAFYQHQNLNKKAVILYICVVKGGDKIELRNVGQKE